MAKNPELGVNPFAKEPIPTKDNQTPPEPKTTILPEQTPEKGREAYGMTPPPIGAIPHRRRVSRPDGPDVVVDGRRRSPPDD